MHTWIECRREEDGLWIVVDPTKNIMVRQSSYYYLNHIDESRTERISRETLLKEEEKYGFLYKANPYLWKLYLSNRKQALKVYDMLKENSELVERLKNDPNCAKYFEIDKKIMQSQMS